MVTSPYEWKIPELDYKPPNKQKLETFTNTNLQMRLNLEKATHYFRQIHPLIIDS